MGISANWSRENLAWAAGLFEGEGCIFTGGRKLKLSVNMTDEDVVRRFLHVVGLGQVSGPHWPRNKGKKPSWTWQTHSSKNTQAILAAFWCFLGDRRLAKAEQAILLAANIARKVGGSACKRGHPLSGENLYLTKRGSRMCRTCNNTKSLERYYKNKNGADQLHHAPKRNSLRASQV